MITASRSLLLFLLCTICLLSIPSTASGNIVRIDSHGIARTYAHEPYIINPTNTTYQDHNLMLNVKFYAEVWGNTNFTMIYSLDEKANQTFPLAATYIPFTSGRHNESYCSGSKALPRLEDGLHKITVYLQLDYEGYNQKVLYHDYLYDEETVLFSIGSSTIPQFILPSATPNTQTQDPTPTPTAPEFPMLSIVFLIMITLAFVLVLRRRSRLVTLDRLTSKQSTL